MIHTNETRKAMRAAYSAHHGQLDRGGMPYVYHLIHVAEQMASEELTCVALLHDILEDTNITRKDLRIRGFSEDIINAVEVLTRKDKESYRIYIENVKRNELSKTVKIADLKHNLDRTRLKKVTERDSQRLEKYKKALMFLEE